MIFRVEHTDLMSGDGPGYFIIVLQQDYGLKRVIFCCINIIYFVQSEAFQEIFFLFLTEYDIFKYKPNKNKNLRVNTFY